MEIPHRQGRVNFDMYVRNRQANYTAAMHNAWEPKWKSTASRRKTDGKRERGKRKVDAKADVVFLSLSVAIPLYDSLSERNIQPSPFFYNIAMLVR